MFDIGSRQRCLKNAQPRKENENLYQILRPAVLILNSRLSVKVSLYPHTEFLIWQMMYKCINFKSVTNLMHKFLYSYNVTVLYMFRAVLCLSSGGQIVCIQHMVSLLSMSGHGGCAVYRLRENSFSTCVLHGHHDHSLAFRVTIPYAV